MPVATVPGFIIKPFCNCIQPYLRTVIDGRLIYTGKKGLSRNIPLRASMGQHYIHLPI